jgi:hypothetical protein
MREKQGEHSFALLSPKSQHPELIPSPIFGILKSPRAFLPLKRLRAKPE